PAWPRRGGRRARGRGPGRRRSSGSAPASGQTAVGGRSRTGGGSSRTQPAASLDPAGSNEVDEIALGDADVATKLHVGDAALRDQPTHKAPRGPKPLGLLNR